MNNPLKPDTPRPDRTDWRERALCREYNVQRGDDPWFSDRAAERALALAICRECPAIQMCATAHSGELGGVWAGQSRGWGSGGPRTGRPPRADALSKCRSCKRATRAYGIRLDEAPGTVAEGRVGFCQACTRKGLT